MSDLHLSSHAKINVFLKILGKRSDGFHEVRTWMLPISLSDDLTFKNSDDGQIRLSCSDSTLPIDESNLVYKAAKLLKSRFNVSHGCSIHVEKRIPIGAGLGGGSSNGSTTLVGLNRLWNLGLPPEQLEKLSAEFGSDTAFFVQNRSALSEGRGEALTYLPYPKTVPIFLMNFGFGSATAWAYKNLGAPLLASIPASEGNGFVSKPFESLLVNDLEKPVFRKFPILKIAKDFLSQQKSVRGAMMCGSGSTMMAVLNSVEDAGSLIDSVTKEFGNSVWTWSGTTLSS